MQNIGTDEGQHFTFLKTTAIHKYNNSWDTETYTFDFSKITETYFDLIWITSRLHIVEIIRSRGTGVTKVWFIRQHPFESDIT